MIFGIPYFYCIEKSGFVYSVDSLRATFFLDEENTQYLFSNYQHIFDWFTNVQLKSEPEVSYRKLEFEVEYSTPNYKKLIAHICISMYSGTIANGFIHFNPNRLFQSQQAYEEITRFFSYCSYLEVCKCDVAIDFPYCICDLVPLKGRKQMRIHFESQKSYTVYWGERNKIGHAKLYSKSDKNKLSENIVRLELTLGNPALPEWKKVLNNIIPPIYLSPFAVSTLNTKLTSPERVIILLAAHLLNDFKNRAFLFRALELYEDKARRKIIKDMILSGNKPLQVDYDAITEVVKTVVHKIMDNQADDNSDNMSSVCQ